MPFKKLDDQLNETKTTNFDTIEYKVKNLIKHNDF